MKIVHGLVYLTAAVVFYAGLGVGLQVNADLGTVLVAAAFALAIGNTVWLLWRRGRGP